MVPAWQNLLEIPTGNLLPIRPCQTVPWTLGGASGRTSCTAGLGAGQRAPGSAQMPTGTREEALPAPTVPPVPSVR